MKNLLILAAAFIWLSGCKKTNSISEIPRITFKSLIAHKDPAGKDTALVLTFEYEDGNGDLGKLNDDDTSKSVFITLFEKKNGEFVALNLVPPFDASMPNLTPKSRNKSISGEISDTITTLPPHVTNDTIKFEVYLVDRANNKSNTIVTNEIVINTQ